MCDLKNTKVEPAPGETPNSGARGRVVQFSADSEVDRAWNGLYAALQLANAHAYRAVIDGIGEYAKAVTRAQVAKLEAENAELRRDSAHWKEMFDERNAQVHRMLAKGYDDEASARIAALQSELAAAKAERQVCDACGGDGKPVSGLPCMCKGTGRADVALVTLREELVKLESELAAVKSKHASLDELRRLAPVTAEATRTEPLVVRAWAESDELWVKPSSGTIVGRVNCRDAAQAQAIADLLSKARVPKVGA